MEHITEQITFQALRPELQVALEAAVAAGRRIMEIYDDPTADFEVEHKSDHSPLTRADRVAHDIICEHLDTLGIPILSEEGRSIPFSERSSWSRLWIVDPLDGTKEFINRNGEFTVNIALVEPCAGRVEGPIDGVPHGPLEPTLGVIYTPATRKLYFADRSLGAFKSVKVLEGCSLRDDLEGAVDISVAMPTETKHKDRYVVVASRSHLSAETESFISALESDHDSVELISKGSSLKICLVADGKADLYPRFAPTCEWDTAAGDAILRARGGALVEVDALTPLEYNKEDLLNPFFIAHPTLL